MRSGFVTTRVLLRPLLEGDSKGSVNASAGGGAVARPYTPQHLGSMPLVVRFRSDGLPVSAEAPGFRVVFQGWNEYLGVQIAQVWTSGATGTENSFRLGRIASRCRWRRRTPA
jgi:hypothetical protein